MYLRQSVVFALIVILMITHSVYVRNIAFLLVSDCIIKVFLSILFHSPFVEFRRKYLIISYNSPLCLLSLTTTVFLILLYQVLSDSTVVSGDNRGHVQLWDGDAGVLMATLHQHTAEVLALAVSPDETQVGQGQSRQQGVQNRVGSRRY